MKLTLIRHGITDGVKRGLVYGATDIPLLPEGEEELKRRRAEKIYPTGARYYTSPLQRTHQTLRLLYGDIPFTVVEDLREMNFGVFEMRQVEGDLENDPVFRAWDADRINKDCPDGESYGNLHRRAVAALEKILAEAGEEDTVCVIHGGVIVSILLHYFPDWDFGKNPILAGDGWQLTIEEGRVVSVAAVPFDK